MDAQYELTPKKRSDFGQIQSGKAKTKTSGKEKKDSNSQIPADHQGKRLVSSSGCPLFL